jgi:hypothetical protein
MGSLSPAVKPCLWLFIFLIVTKEDSMRKNTIALSFAAFLAAGAFAGTAMAAGNGGANVHVGVLSGTSIGANVPGVANVNVANETGANAGAGVKLPNLGLGNLVGGVTGGGAAGATATTPAGTASTGLVGGLLGGI